MLARRCQVRLHRIYIISFQVLTPDCSLPLLDIDTENPTNFEMLRSWIADLVLEYNIDGLRISAARYIRQSFWRDFTGASGVFAIGEVCHS